MNMEFTNSKDLAGLLSNEALLQPKVLLIEDCQFDRTLIQKMLKDYYPEASMDCADTRVSALQKLKNNIYDIVFLDLELPDTISLQDIAEFRSHAQKTPLIIVTGHFNEDSIAAANKHGANGIISKEKLVTNGVAAAIQDAVENIINA